jgi:hypothetical protein
MPGGFVAPIIGDTRGFGCESSGQFDWAQQALWFFIAVDNGTVNASDFPRSAP